MPDPISIDDIDLNPLPGKRYFSIEREWRDLYPQEILVAYNVSAHARRDRVIVDATLHPDSSQMTFLYGNTGSVAVQTSSSGARFLKLDLEPHQFVILA